MSYQFRAVEQYWKSFHALPNERKELLREKWEIFKVDPFHHSLESRKAHRLSALAKHTIYSVVIEKHGDLRVTFRIDGNVVTTLDVGTHDLYR